jgi:gliding motility associated protien GldN
MLRKFLFLVIGIGISVGMNAQDPQEQIITESGTPLEEAYPDGLFNRTLTQEAQIIEFDTPRESDVVWERKLWRVIDVREKINVAFRSPIKPFFTILREMAENGDVAVFADEGFREPMTIEQIDKELNRIDTTTVFDYDTYEEKVQVIRNEINWENIKKYRVKEVWYFDKEASILKARILGISPILDEVDADTGELKYSRPLFWVYYPEAREHLAKFRVQNEGNDIAPLSWYDLFESRQFASYIMKRSNTLDLRIADKFQGYEREGIDRLMESDKIKAELFNFEHDLWEY